LHQIILNLVGNAVKFTIQGKIIVEVKLLSQDDHKVTIAFSVSDTGIGISEDNIEKIFDNFQQASSNTSRLYGGTGLGLAIVKQLVEAQGGTIDLKSKLGEGSTFSFTLDFMKTKARAITETEIIELDSDIKHIKILVVEDMSLNQLLMRTVLEDFGFECEIAENGSIAIEKLKVKKFEIVLMDLQMPEMNGFEATTYIRKTMKSTIPIIALTADVTTADLEKCKSVGMNDYIPKPIDERLLYTKIVSLVKKPASNFSNNNESDITIKTRCIDLNYLNKRTKSNPILMMEMITIYLEQTPHLIKSIKQSLKDKDWVGLYSSAHKIIPSFSIMGIDSEFEKMAKTIQEYANTQKQSDDIHNMVTQLENICVQACQELEIEFNNLKNN
jgi:CheY-like chemotaxis protein